jgi:hypothetical protein
MEKFLEEARKFAYSEMERTGIPSKYQAEVSMEIGRRLAKELGVNADIVEVGTLLMDCMIGQAVEENRQSEHVKMSLNKTNELLGSSSLSEEERENIRHCVSEHHGVEKFYSKESEVVCNSDCYKFVSIKGFCITLRYTRDMPFADLVILLKNKADEKWNAISFDIVKKELAPQHQMILEILKDLSEEK